MKKKPELSSELANFRDVLIQSSSNDTKIDVWDVKGNFFYILIDVL